MFIFLICKILFFQIALLFFWALLVASESSYVYKYSGLLQSYWKQGAIQMIIRVFGIYFVISPYASSFVCQIKFSSS